MEATGAYLRTLREGRKLSRTEVAARIGTNEAQIVRIEAGEIDTRGSLLIGFLETVSGSYEHLQWLIRSPGARAAQGSRFAESWLNNDQSARLRELIETSSDDELGDIFTQIREEVEEDPTLLEFLRGVIVGWRGKRGGVHTNDQ